MGSAAFIDQGLKDEIDRSMDKDLETIVSKLPAEARSELLDYVQSRASEAASLSDPEHLLLQRQFGFDTYQLSKNMWKCFLTESESCKGGGGPPLYPGECKVTRFEYDWDLRGGHDTSLTKFSKVLRGCLSSDDSWEYSIWKADDPGDSSIQTSAASLLLVTSVGMLRISETYHREYHDSDTDSQHVTTLCFCDTIDVGNDTAAEQKKELPSLSAFHDLRLFEERTKDSPDEVNEARLMNAGAADARAPWQHLHSSAHSYMEHLELSPEMGSNWTKEVGSVDNVMNTLSKLSGRVVHRSFDDCSTDEEVKTAALAAFLKGFGFSMVFPCAPDVSPKLAVVQRKDGIKKTSLRKEPSNSKAEEVIVHPAVLEGTEVEAKVFKQCPSWAFVQPKDAPDHKPQGWIKLKNLEFQ